MKISRPGSPSLIEPSKAPQIAEAKVSAAKPEKAAAKEVAKPHAEAPTPQAPGKSARVSDIAADLKAGKLSSGAALDKVIERVLDQQLGTRAPGALREKVGAALREALADDPLLVSKVRSLGED